MDRRAPPGIHGGGRASRPTDVLLTLVERQLRLWTKRSWMGAVWPIISPFFLLALYAFVFGRVFRAPIPRYHEFLFSGLLPWVFLSQGLVRALPSISGESDLIRKARFPYEFLPLSTVAAHALSLFVTLGLFLTWLAAVGHLSFRALPAALLPLAALILLVMGLSLLVALIDVYNRDLRIVLGNVLTVWLFLSPVAYRQSAAPRPLQALQQVDPFSLIVGQLRVILYQGRVGQLHRLALMMVLCAAVFITCRTVFRRLSTDLPKDV